MLSEVSVVLKKCSGVFALPLRRSCLKCHSKRRSTIPRLDIPSLDRTLHTQTHYITKQRLYSLDNPLLLNHVKTVLKNLENGLNSKNSVVHASMVNLMERRNELIDNIKNLNQLINGDEDLRKISEEEYSLYQNELSSVDDKILDLLVPRGNYDDCDGIVLEVQSGAGGQEAMLFAGELLHLYERFSLSNGWTFHIDSLDKSDLGGIKSTVVYINGPSSYYYMQNEIGVHRVQRHPSTERSGRIHTSTAAVVVVPQPTEVDIRLSDKDLQFEYMRASGPGGQNVNKTESAVRLKHLPSGVYVESSTSRSQIENREIAMIKLRAKLFAIEEEKQSKEVKAARQSQLGNRDRSEKIRTYNVPQDRITDHRFHLSKHNLKSYMEGGDNFRDFLNKLNEQNRIKQYSDLISTLNTA